MHLEGGSKLAGWDKSCLIHLRHLRASDRQGGLEGWVVNVHLRRILLISTLISSIRLVVLDLFRKPFNREHHVELRDVETLQGRLSIEGTKEILEVDVGGLFVVKHLNALDSSELAEDLINERSQMRRIEYLPP